MTLDWLFYMDVRVRILLFHIIAIILPLGPIAHPTPTHHSGLGTYQVAFPTRSEQTGRHRDRLIVGDVKRWRIKFVDLANGLTFRSKVRQNLLPWTQCWMNFVVTSAMDLFQQRNTYILSWRGCLKFLFHFFAFTIICWLRNTCQTCLKLIASVTWSACWS